jgi:hypothetical protein
MEINVNGVQITLTEEQLKKIKKQTEKVSAEKRFLDLWNGCAIKFDFEKYPERIFLMKDNMVMFEQDFKNGYLWCDYKLVWSVFENEYGFTYTDIQSFIKDVVERHFKMGVITPQQYEQVNSSRWKDISK